MDNKDLNRWSLKSSLQEFKIHEQQPVAQPQQAAQQPSLIRRVSKRNIAIGKAQPAQDQTIFETFEPQQKAQTQHDLQFIIQCFKGHFVFSSMSDSQLLQLAKSMFYCRLAPGQVIIKQNDNASSFFIIEKGRINVLVDQIPRKELIAGNGFGELALLYTAPRSATCVAAEESFLWGIDRHTFRKSVESIMSSEQERNSKYLENVKFFSQLTKEQKDAVAGVLISQKFAKNEVIVNEGDQASSFYIIAQGSVGVFTKEGQQVATLGANESFGESSMKGDNQVRQMTIKAVEADTKVLALGKDMIIQILGDQVQTIINKNICKWALNNSKLFSTLPHGVVDKLLEGLQINKVAKGSKLISKGDKVGQLIIIMEGVALDDTKKKVASKSEIVLEESLQDKNRGTLHSNNIYLDADGMVGTVNYDIFREQQGSVEHIVKGQQEKSESSNAFLDLIKKKQLKDLIYINKLGSGQFGSVYLCKFKDLDTLFALKYVTRAHVVQFGIQKHIQQEKAVLDLMEHQFILKFYRSFKDNENIYFLTEFIPGMELFDAIRVIGLLNKPDAQFYAASMILQVEYLHSVHQIVYRDIKPENAMVDDLGYLKLIDMGTAKSFKNAPSNKTFTIIGTPHYMAPEIISGKGYGTNADLWSVGVCLYEFICGGLPFGEEAEDPFEIYKEICKKPITYPGFMTDKTAKPFIEQLMNKIPEVRLGGSYTTLKSHPWLKDFQWDQLMAKKLKPPVLPGKDKILNPEQIKGLIAKNICVVDQINKDTQGTKKVLASAKDSEWDHCF